MRIDIHTHVFNLRSLPLRGILRRWKVPDLLALATAKLFLALVEDGDFVTSPATLGARLPDDAIPLVAAAAPAELFHDPDFLAGLLYLGPAALAAPIAPLLAARGLGLRFEPQLSAETLASLNLAALDAATRASLVERLLRKVESLIEGGAAAIRFLHLLTRSERHILETYRTEYPEVDLSVHHMMDLECHYPPDPPVYSYPADQVSRMRKLAASSNGRLLVFAAFDPYRTNCQEIIEAAIAAGCAGVKYYPPSGYKPSGNRDGEYDGPPAWQLDDRSDRLFAFCARAGVPVFTHCTPSGFTARDDYGRFADPAWWGAVLSKYPRLVLGFGHAGGGEGWFSPLDAAGQARFDKSFAGGVFRLMQQYDDVYLDFGYLDDVLVPAQLVSLRNRLEAMIAGSPRLAQRIMYGSDWHMLYKEAKSEEYLRAFESVFTGPLAPHRDAFFGGNAVRYLGLPAYLTRNQRTLSPSARSHLEGILRADVDG